MAAPTGLTLGLLVARPPYAARAPRAELDLALAAAALDYRLEIYFLGSAVLQLADDRGAEPAMLPSGYRAVPEQELEARGLTWR